jgi:bacillithiol system protein YtxJ
VASHAAGGGEAGPLVYVVKVIEARPVSNAVAERLNVQHQSPQIILVRGGAAVWSASHFNITAESMNEALTRSI